MGILSESGGFGLFGSEEALLLLGYLEEPLRRFSMRLGMTQYYNFLDVTSNRRSSTRSTAAGGKSLPEKGFAPRIGDNFGINRCGGESRRPDPSSGYPDFGLPGKTQRAVTNSTLYNVGVTGNTMNSALVFR